MLCGMTASLSNGTAAVRVYVAAARRPASAAAASEQASAAGAVHRCPAGSTGARAQHAHDRNRHLRPHGPPCPSRDTARHHDPDLGLQRSLPRPDNPGQQRPTRSAAVAHRADCPDRAAPARRANAAQLRRFPHRSRAAERMVGRGKRSCGGHDRRPGIPVSQRSTRCHSLVPRSPDGLHRTATVAGSVRRVPHPRSHRGRSRPARG